MSVVVVVLFVVFAGVKVKRGVKVMMSASFWAVVFISKS
jgi:hypothetical protein